jgi:PAS domain S-box-containing protein
LDINSFKSTANSSRQVLNWIKEASFEKVIDVIEDYAIVVLDANGNIVLWSLGAERFLGYKGDEIVGRNFKLFFSIEDKNHRRPEVLLLEAFKRGKAIDEGWRLRKDGSLRWASISLSSIRDADKQIIGYISLTRDLTDKKIIEDSQSTKAEELRQRNVELARSENQYHKMIAEVQDYAMILLSPDGDILDWNRGAEHIKKYKAADIVGRNFKIFYSNEDKIAHLPERLLNEARTLGRVNHEGWRIRKDGTRFWGSVTITALHDDDNELIGFSKVTRDLTERKMSEDRLANASEELRDRNKELRRSEEQYHRMVSEVSDYAILLLDVNGTILNWNAGAEQIKGYSAEEIIGKSFRIFYTNEDRLARLPEMLLDQALAQGRTSHEGWRVRKDGTKFWGGVVITALHDENNNVIGFTKVTRDLTERKRADDELRETAAKLQTTNQELASFTHVASHDLKEPLRKIRVFLSQVEDVEMSEKVRRSFSKIEQSARNMQGLIDDLLAYSVVAYNKTEYSPTDLNQVARGAIGDVEILLEDKGGRIDVGSLPTINGIAFQLRQVFQNLLSNALKFSRPGVAPLISIRCDQVNGSGLPALNGSSKFFRISVIDNGLGFNQEDASHIFDPFARLAATKAIPGTGIGLAIVKKVIENHGGTVTAEAIAGKGATISLYLPAGSPAK